MRSLPQDSPETRAARRLAAGSILLALGIVFVHGPAQVYAGSVEERLHSLPEVLIGGLGLAAALGLLLTLPLWLVGRRTLRAWAVSWFVIASLTWVSSSFLVLETGPLDGRVTELDVPWRFALSSLALLAAVAVASALLALRQAALASFATLILNLLLLAVTVWTAVSRSAAPLAGAQQELDRFFRFSTSENVLVVLTDSFQADMFAELVAAKPSLRRDLDGFTYFPDTVGAAASTFVSLPTIHSGRSYDPGEALVGTYERRIRRGSFLVALAATGFETTLANPVGGRSVPHDSAAVTSEAVLGRSRRAAFEEYGELLDISLFRAAPGPLKRWFYNGGGWRARAWVADRAAANRPYRDLRMLAALGERAVVSGERPTAKFLHTFISHPPVELDERCRPLAKPIPLSRDSMRFQASCTVEALVELFSVLERRGVYDATAIAIVADHGLGLPRPDLPPPGRSTPSWAAMEAFSNALLLYKPLRARGPLRDSPQPMSIGDLAGMICADTGDCAASLQIPPPPELDPGRARLFHHYEWSTEYWASKRIPSLRTFAIRGPVWSVRSWSRIGSPELPLDHAASFGSDADARMLLDWGWGEPEAWGVPTDGPVAVLSFRPGNSSRQRPLRLTAKLRRTTRRGDELSVAVRSNGKLLDTWRFATGAERASFDVALPVTLQRSDDGGVTLELSVGSTDGSDDVEPEASGTDLDLGLESLLLRGT